MQFTRSRSIRRTVLLLAALAIVQRTASAQSAWTQPEGGGFVQLSLTTVGPYDELFQRKGPDFRTGRDITESTLQVYGELGLTEDWTFIGIVPVKFLDAGSSVSNPSITPTTIEDGENRALGNVTVGLRKQLHSGSYAVAAQLDVEAPTGEFEKSTGLSSGYDAFTFLPTLNVGRGFGRAYAQGYVGAAFRTDGFSDDYRVGGEAGYRITDTFLLAGTFALVDSRSNGDVTLDPTNLETGLYVDQQEYTSFGLKGLVDLSDTFGIQAALGTAADGNNVAKAPYLSIGVYFRL